MKIIVLIGEVGFVSHKNFMNGILESALVDHNDVYLFTCEGWHSDRRKVNEKAEYKIFELPDFKEYDGVIVDLNTIHNSEICDKIVERICEAGIPCITINTPINAKNSITIHLENKIGLEEVIRHLVNEHQVNEVCYVSGPLHNIDAVERKQVFLDTMSDLKLNTEESEILYGDFTYYGGKKLADEYLDSGKKLPDAFIAANDFMAIGIMIALQERGYKIPQDVIVTGYDDIDLAGCVEPRLTTVDRGEYDAGKMSYELLKNKQYEDKNSAVETIYGKAVFSVSCGCGDATHAVKKALLMDMAAQQIYMDNSMELLKAVMIQFSVMSTLQELGDHLKWFVENMEIECFYLCLCGSEESIEEEKNLLIEGKEVERDRTVYTDKFWIPYAYENGKWNEYKDFEGSKLIPTVNKYQNTGMYYIVLPVHHESECLGYCVIGNSKDVPDGRFIQHMVLNINNAIGNILKKDIMEGMYAKINRRWVYDELTGIYNRSGLAKYAPPFVERAKLWKKNVAVIFLDLDGLKRVNDIMGHESGDKYIKSMADVLKRCSSDEDILVRYGGDEYLVITAVNDRQEVEEYISIIEREINTFNQEQSDVKLSASIGFDYEDDVENVDLNKIIDRADKEMYKVKRMRKNRRTD